MYRLELRRRLRIPSIEYKKEKKEVRRQLKTAKLLKAAANARQKARTVYLQTPLPARPITDAKQREENKPTTGQSKKRKREKESSGKASKKRRCEKKGSELQRFLRKCVLRCE